jgi:hypothetical protein
VENNKVVNFCKDIEDEYTTGGENNIFKASRVTTGETEDGNCGESVRNTLLVEKNFEYDKVLQIPEKKLEKPGSKNGVPRVVKSEEIISIQGDRAEEIKNFRKIVAKMC